MQHRTVMGVGINDADYPVGQGKCPYYSRWLSTMQRCYSPKLHQRNPGYRDVTVHPDWLQFSNFKAWMEQQDWQGRSLDKDLLMPGNTVYGPATCVFIPQGINTLLNEQPNKGGQFPKGVHEYKPGKFKAIMRKNKKSHHIGVFPTPMEAARAYCHAKADWIDHHADQETNNKAKQALRQAADRLRRSY